MATETKMPEEYRSLLELAATARGQDRPLPSLNVMTAGGADSEKLALTQAYGAALHRNKFIRQKPSVVDCDKLTSIGTMFARLTEEFGRAQGGMIIFHNVGRFADDATVLSTLLDLSKETDCVVALVDEKRGLERLCRLTSGIMAQFPTMMDADNPLPPKSNEELAMLASDVKAMKKLQLKKPEG